MNDARSKGVKIIQAFRDVQHLRHTMSSFSNSSFKHCVLRAYISFRDMTPRNERHSRCSSTVMQDRVCYLLGDTLRRMGERLGALTVAR